MDLSNASDARLIITTGELERHFNDLPFLVGHRLHQTGAFSLSRIRAVAERVLSSDKADLFTALDLGKASVASKFSSKSPEAQVAEAIDRLNEAGSWVKITRAQDFDQDYNDILNAIRDEIQVASKTPIRPNLTWSTMTIFLSSPGISTPYHIDHESNFLFQIQGEKDVCLFDQNDRELLPGKEIERFYNGDVGAALFRESHQSRGTVFRLSPGQAVHHPPLAPHWVKNGNEVSISVSVAFCMRPLEQRARVFQANHMLRQIGVSPTDPGTSAMKDWFKMRLMSAFEKKDSSEYRDIVYGPIDRLKRPFHIARRFMA